MNGKKNRTHKSRLKTAERRHQCITLRLSGATYRVIAEQLGITPAAAYKHVSKHLYETRAKTQEAGDELRQIEADRLDRLMMGVWSRAVNGDGKAIEHVLKIMERRARMLGIDAPSKVAPTDPEGKREYRGGGLSALLEEARAGKADGDVEES